MRFSVTTLTVLASLFVAPTYAIVPPVADICCVSGSGPDPCASVTVKPLVMNPVPLASLAPEAICCCVAANPLACRTVC
jgi:hypothetical protein